MNLMMSLNMDLFSNAALQLMLWSDSLMAFISNVNTIIIYLLRLIRKQWFQIQGFKIKINTPKYNPDYLYALHALS